MIDVKALIAEAKTTQGYSEGDLRSLIRALADALEQSRPRVVETVEELDALPVDTVIRTNHGLVFEHAKWTRYFPWRTPNSTNGYSASAISLPATVLYTPEEATKPEAPELFPGTLAALGGLGVRK